MTEREIDERYMRMALDEAREGLAKGEIPIGAVVVSRGRVIGRGHNLTETLTDVTAHAEMLALTAACNTTGGKYLPDCTIYVTVEPCTMCAGALGWSHIGRIVYGASDDKRGYISMRQQAGCIRHEAGNAIHPKTIIKSGVLEDECKDLMQQFFKKLRQ